MEPAFYRGDLLFLTNPPNQRYQTGDITVYKVPGADIPIVHRVLETHDLVSSKKGCVCSIFRDWAYAYDERAIEWLRRRLWLRSNCC